MKVALNAINAYKLHINTVYMHQNNNDVKNSQSTSMLLFLNANCL